MRGDHLEEAGMLTISVNAQMAKVRKEERMTRKSKHTLFFSDNVRTDGMRTCAEAGTPMCMR